MIKFSILITTKNRRDELNITLRSLKQIMGRDDVELIVCDDGSNDGTYNYIKKEYPNIILLNNKKNIGLIASRNRLLSETTAQYAIFLDDDAHFLSSTVLETIETHFAENNNCGVIACRIFWGIQEPHSFRTLEKPLRVKGFVGCGHVWNMKAWRNIANYPEWYIFYGEEEYASYQLFKKGWQVHYLPDILVHHRVAVKDRKKQNDYALRLRRSLRSGWYNYMLFLPLIKIPRKLFYTLFIQLKLKVFRGDLKAAIPILQALWDLLVHLPLLLTESKRLTQMEFKEYQNLADTKIYWQPKETTNA
ncbi:glycosyltransferase family 2 protein [Aequorivita flava]|uniref:Glycosyltransferase n=1 Tax=Aequorivita flava TaxID=3114371 RepID=A0AB35YT39_9FLAO